MSTKSSRAISIASIRSGNTRSINPAATKVACKAYKDVWAAEIEARGWSRIFDEENAEFYPRPRGHVTILDIGSTGDLNVWRIDLPNEYHGGSHPIPHEWARVARGRLRSDTSDVKLRVIVFHRSTYVLMRELVGLHYDIGPEFFRDITHSYPISPSPGRADPHDHRLLGTFVGRSPQHLNFGYGWVAKTIAATSNDSSAATISLPPAAAALVDQDSNFNYKVSRAKALYQSGGYETVDVDLSEAYVASICNSGQQRNDWRRLSHLAEQAWHSLRMLKHDGAGPLDCFRWYDTDHNSGRTLMQPEFIEISQELGEILHQIGRTEQLARDYLQAQVSGLSLEESRESIKQSKISLEEGKRTKLVTILAFFFVPVSIGTSIFGMNIREINQTGRPIWVFIVTTVAIFAVSTTIWTVFCLHHLLNSLPEGSYWEQQPDHLGTRADGAVTSAEYNVSWRVRLYLFLRLIRHGHIAWAWKSGIAFSLYTGGRRGFIRSCTAHESNWPDLSPKADEYLNKHVTSFEIDGVHSPCTYIVMHLDFNCGFECHKLQYY